MSEIKRIKDKWGLSGNNVLKSGVEFQKECCWIVWFDLYLELRRVLRSLNIQHYLLYDALLGAVKYGTFLQGGGDLNVGIFRSDYEKLLQNNRLFNWPYFLQDVTTDVEYGYSFMKLCNSNTTCDVETFRNCDYNHGMVIDIFPIDYIRIEDYNKKRSEIKALIMKNSASMRYRKDNKSEHDLSVISRYYSADNNLQETIFKINSIAKEEKIYPYVSTLTCTVHEMDNSIWPASFFGKAVEIPFLWDNVTVCYEYINMLNISYGFNFMIDRSIDNRIRWSDVKYYPEMPFKEFYKKPC